MNNKLQTITRKLEKLMICWSKVTSELANVDTKITATIQARNSVQCTVSCQSVCPSVSAVNDSVGVLIVKGDHVQSVTRGKYFERKAKTTKIIGNKAFIEYLRSKQLTWRYSSNLRKIEKQK